MRRAVAALVPVLTTIVAGAPAHAGGLPPPRGTAPVWPLGIVLLLACITVVLVARRSARRAGSPRALRADPPG